MKKILFILGTRPEAIKLAPLILELKKEKLFKPKVCITSQHKKLLKQVLGLFNIKPDFDLNVMTSNQSISSIIFKISKKLENIIKKNSPDLIIVQGDTTSAMTGALIGSMHKIDIAHVEAGLRTFDNFSPWPEELNRNIISKLSSLNFCPTNKNLNNLKRENIKNLYLTGNTIANSLEYIQNKFFKSKKPHYEKKFKNFLNKDNKVFLTIHRRENFGSNLNKIINLILYLSKKNINFFIPVHPNPNIRKMINKRINNKTNIFLSKPINYDEGVFLMKNSDIIMSDSGGLQEEATFLKKKIIILRETTERPEVLNKFGILAGCNRKKIIKHLTSHLKKNNKRINFKSPFGDKSVTKKIIKILKKKYAQR